MHPEKNKKFKHWANTEQVEESFVKGKLKLNDSKNEGEDFKRYTLKDFATGTHDLKLPVGTYTVEVTGGNGAFKLAGQGSNIITKIEVIKETDSNGVSVVKAKMKAGVDHIKLFQEINIENTHLLSLKFREKTGKAEANQEKAIPNVAVKVKLHDDSYVTVYSNESGIASLVFPDGKAPKEAEIIKPSAYLNTAYANQTTAGGTENDVVTLTDGAGGIFNGAGGADISKDIFLKKDPAATEKFGTVEITAVTRDIESVQKPVKGVEYTLFNGETVVAKGETNQYGKLTLKNIPVPQGKDFAAGAAVGTTLEKVYQLKQTKTPQGFEENKLSNELKFILTKALPANTMTPENFKYNLRFDVNAPALRDLAGYNRFGTAARISQKIYDTASIASDAKKVPAIVIVNGLDFADGLAAGPFAQKFDGKNPSTGVADAAYKTAPVLLVTKNEIPEETLKEIKRLTNDKEGAALKKTKIYVIGGKNAVSDDVVSKLKALKGISEVNVLAGANRYETAAIVAKAMHDFGALSEVVLVNGLDFADALGGGTLAIDKGAALLLNHPKEVTTETADFIARPEIKKATVIGGKNAISDEAIKGYKATITRVFGADRYETSVEVAKSISGAAKAYVASGLTFADALALTPYIRMTGSDGIILLTAPKELPVSVRKFLNTNKATFGPYGTNTFIVGGENAVSAEVEKVLKEEVLK